MKIVKSCREVKSAKPTFCTSQFESSLKPGDVFYRVADIGQLNSNGLIVLMRVSSNENKYINLLSASPFDTLSANKEYFLAPDATMVLNIKD